MSAAAGNHKLRAVLFDLDGTLYHQAPVRKHMARELMAFLLRSPLRAPGVVRGIRAYRRVREELRELGCPTESLDELQYSAPTERTGRDPAALRRHVEEWMIQRPLPAVARAAREDLHSSLALLKTRGVPMGVYSDYPVGEKLDALGCRESFSLELCSTDADINAFKPHPRGFERACERWELPPSEVLFVGDRADVDAAGARAAGMPCALVGSDRADGVQSFETLAELIAAFLDRF